MQAEAADLDAVDAVEVADDDVAATVDVDPRVDRGDERIVEHDVARGAPADGGLRLASRRRDAMTGPHPVVAAEDLDHDHGFHRIDSRYTRAKASA